MEPQQPPAGMSKRRRPPVPAAPLPAAPPAIESVAATPAVEAALALPALPAHLRPVPGHVPPKPPQTQALTTKQRTVTPMEEAAFGAVEADMGGRLQMVATLSTAQLPKAIERILGAIADPDNDRVSLAKICAVHDVSMVKLLAIFREALLARGKLQATVKIATMLPAVAAQVMDDAVAGERVCAECLGAMKVADPTTEDPERTKVCGQCRGKGMVRFIPDHETQKTALKIGGLLEQGGMKIAVNQQTFSMGGAGGEEYDRLVTALDGALYGHGRERLRSGDDEAVDGEVLNGAG